MESIDKPTIKKYWFWIVIVLLLIAKQLMVTSIPIWARDYGGQDEWLMVTMAKSILKGEYLGAYYQHTLVKGIGFPVFLAMCRAFGFSYLAAITLLHSLACILALQLMSKFTDKKLVMLFAFAFLLFSPCTYSLYNVQLVYRNGFTIPLTMIVITCLMEAYLCRDTNLAAYFWWNAGATLTAAVLWNTREDTMWILPLLAVVFLIICIELLKKRKQIDGKQLAQKGLIATMPLITLFLSIQAISALNWHYYGVYTTNELNGTNFSKAFTSILEVQPESYPESCSVTRATLKKLYEASPSMAEIGKIIEHNCENGGNEVKTGRDITDDEIEDGYMVWALRDAASQVGYYKDAQTANAFWGRVYDEIQAAFNAGLLKKRSAFPARTYHPWVSDRDYLQKWLSCSLDLLVRAAKHNEDTTDIVTNDNDDVTRLYECISGNYAVYAAKTGLRLSGWIFVPRDVGEYSVWLTQADGTRITQLSFYDSPDVVEVGKSHNGEYYNNAEKCRYNIDVGVAKSENMNLSVYLPNGTLYSTVPIGEKGDLSSKNIRFWFDVCDFYKTDDKMMPYAKFRVDIANMVGESYRMFGLTLFATAFLFYLFITYRLFPIRRPKNAMLVNAWLLLTAILSCLLVIVLGIGYVQAFEYDCYKYLGCASILADFFVACTVVFAFGGKWSRVGAISDGDMKK